MFKKFLLALSVLTMGAATSHADWIVRSGEDPITDQKWVAMATTFGQYVMTFKCWKGGPTQIAIAMGRYDPNMPYKNVIDAKVRVDKMEPVELNLMPGEMTGMLILQMSSEVSDAIIPLLKQLGTAKDRVVLAIGTVALTTSPRGAPKGSQAMVSGCAISDKSS